MKDYTKDLPAHVEKHMGENDLFVEIFEGLDRQDVIEPRPPLLFVHGAYTGSWMWSRYMPHFIREGWSCHVMNLRSHYKSRSLDLTKVTFEDYLEDVKEVIKACGAPPILIGFSMGGILGQKLAETVELAGLVLVDSVISREVFDRVPYKELERMLPNLILPAPEREEHLSIDETADDIAFQKKYLSMESWKAVHAFAYTHDSKGIAVDSSLITCPCLVVKAVNCEEDDLRGQVSAELLRAAYTGIWNTTHTGVLVGQRYTEAVDAILEWMKRF
ncbi:alpha/beta hydrolase family protein [Paenibacillus hexagrammi]|uniref:Alpha/beta fold hydrolase n=1 Tax=Paenibacillus hexagrammi TaxID=2908839 RepID=A0ABY3SLQ6_9BACL|nr:alpha/beta hydrolase family protein [Paenibacillus sp. YPD9-1]UJF33882.1 alpha/beta fold hydrolase [Paenibacillus sp. YPD9-1]